MTKNEQWLIDLDGVIWLGDQAIAGGDEALNTLRGSGRSVAFFTNNSYPTRGELQQKLRGFGITCADEELFSSAQSAARMCKAGERALYVAGPGVAEALKDVNVEAIDADDYQHGELIDVVIVGIDPTFNYARLSAATEAVFGGARLMGTNEDATYPTKNGPVPGGGAILHAVAYATKSTPLVTGKPNDAAIVLVRSSLGAVDVAIGDRFSTDGLFVARLDAAFGYVHSGITESLEENPGVNVAFEAADLLSLVTNLTTGN